MFERFTDRARRVLVLAQEEARHLNHNYIGTEHILLGLIDEGEGIAAKALESLGLSLAAVREKVEGSVGPGDAATTGSPPFTPRAKKALELSLREALQLGHNYIGTEHVLLGLVREGGVAAQVLQSVGVDLGRVRETVISLLSGHVQFGGAHVATSDSTLTREGRIELGRHRFASRVIEGPDQTLVDEGVRFRITGILLDEQEIGDADGVEVLWLITGIPAPVLEAMSDPAHASSHDVNQRYASSASGYGVLTPYTPSWHRDHSILQLSDDTEARFRVGFEVTGLRRSGEIAGCSLFLRTRADDKALDAARSLTVEWRGQAIDIGLG